MQMYPNPAVDVAARVPGLAQAAFGLQMAASPLFNARQRTYHTGEGSLFGLGAIETWRSTSPPPVLGRLGAYETWRTSGLGRLGGALGRIAVNPDMVSLGQAEAAANGNAAAVPNGNGGAYVPDVGVAATVGGAAIALTVAAGIAGAIFGSVHGYARHKKSMGWAALWGTAGLLFPGYTIAAGVAQRQVGGWRRG